MELMDILKFAVENGVLFMTICYFMYNQTVITKELINSINELKLIVRQLIDEVNNHKDDRDNKEKTSN